MSKYTEAEEHLICFLTECSMWCKENHLTETFKRAIEALQIADRLEQADATKSAEYIEKTKLLEQVSKDSAGHEGMYGDEWIFMDTISDMPTIDIVTCKECKYGNYIDDGERLKCFHWLYRIDENCHEPNWYCADGERKGAK